MEKTKRIVNNLLPYVLLFLFALLGNYIVFYKGFPSGDDFTYHFGNILDQYRMLEDGHSFSPISGNLALGLGVGNRLFYSPLTHFMATLIYRLIDVFNGSIILAVELLIIGSVFISAIFMYRFVMHFSNNNKIASIIAAAVFTLYPYRIFDAFCRLALAEAIAIAFLPLFFMGLYDVTHFKDNKVNSIAFIEVILGGSLLFISHNITALYAFIAGIIYLLVNIKNIIKLFKAKKYILYACISIVLLIGISSIALFNQLELMSLKIYNFTNEIKMWTNVDKVVSRADEAMDYSGFLNIPFLSNNLGKYVKTSSLILSIVLFVVANIIFIIVDKALSEIKKINRFSLFISIPVLFLLVSLVGRRIEIYLATILVVLIYIYISFNVKTSIDNKENGSKTLIKDPMFWYCLAMCLLVVFMMESQEVWKVVPSLFRNIQFPWRLWALIQIFVSMLVGVIIYHFNYKKFVYFFFAIISGLLVVTNMPSLEKRLYCENMYSSKWYGEVVEENVFSNWRTLGHCREYLPEVLIDPNYQSEYENTLQYYARVRLDGDYRDYKSYVAEPIFLVEKPVLTVGENNNFYINGIDSNIEYVDFYDEDDVYIALNGNWAIGSYDSKIKASVDGSIEVNSAYAPNYDFVVNVNEDATIHMPLIYYPGYEIIVTNLDDNSTYTLKGKNIDGLVAFDINKGNYSIKTEFVGSIIRQTSEVYFYISISLTSLALIYGLLIENKKYKKIIKLFKKDNNIANK